MPRYADIAVPVVVHTAFTYELPEACAAQCRPGCRVVVPFRRKQVVGIILQTETTPPPTARCKPIAALCDPEPVLNAQLLELVQWISRYYAAPIGEVCRAALPTALFRAGKPLGRPRRAAHLHQEHTLSDAAAITLNAAQHMAADAIAATIRDHAFRAFLLHGITGSGKTEVYLAAVERCLAAHRQAIVLLPEIGLTPQLLAHLSARFGDAIALYHSDLTEAERLHQWQRMARGEARVCCGTRSAVFAPFDRLGCIIVDEEHDASYKQEDDPRYHARDVAVRRAQAAQAAVVLGSATPSLESFHNVGLAKYTLLPLTERPTGQPLPTVSVIDLREHAAGTPDAALLSAPLRVAMHDTLARGEQVLLFLNRRGFATMSLCRDCGHIFRCPNCAISLTLHHSKAQLRCHYCEFTINVPRSCPACGSAQLKAVGSGTERIEQLLQTQFPTARIARMDRDTSTSRHRRHGTLRAMHSGTVDILIGTQMITKGHDFPRVTLVGVILADLSLYLPDFRAAERTFQLLTQVAGRAGRADRPGQVIIQTYTPEHYSLLCARGHDYAAFVSEETKLRADLNYPPFGRLLNIRLSGNHEAQVHAYAEQLANALHRFGGTESPATSHQSSVTSHPFSLLGPAPSPREKIAGKYRWQILLKLPDTRAAAGLTQLIRRHSEQEGTTGVHVAIDVDPVHLL
ncbi:MAG: primosomal protein N' [Deltaproteobacteria bacterium]|nr:primosomal protein N' [Deltaproteobacteria bacterium]